MRVRDGLSLSLGSLDEHIHLTFMIMNQSEFFTFGAPGTFRIFTYWGYFIDPNSVGKSKAKA